MKKAVGAIWFSFLPILLIAGPRDAQWKAVEEATNKGLPKTAITNLEPIIAGALKEKAYAEAVKAIGKKIVLEGNIQGNHPEEKITRLEAEIAKAPTEVVPVLDTLLAHWYWEYFQRNRWRFMQRTATTQAPGKDFTTWDLPRLFAEIDRQFQNGLKAEALLKATPIATWDDLLQKGTMPDGYRPTLYDFVTHEALEFYTSGAQAAAKSESSFELSADSPILDPAPKFLDWKPESTEQGFSPLLRAISLYQSLLKFHRSDSAPQLAFANADLERLQWGWNTAFGESKDARYRTALEGFIKTYGDFEISTLALHSEALLFQQQQDLVMAHELASRGGKLFPQSPGSKLCRNLVGQIEAKSAVITTERVWTCFDGSGVGLPAAGENNSQNQPQQCPVITLQYRNIKVVYFRAIPYNWEAFLQKRHHRPESLSEAERREVLAQPAALEWSEQLPPTADFKDKTAVLPAPATLKPGFYFIASSHDPKFSEKGNIVSLATVWVTDLALVTRTGNGRFEGFVLAANSGEPIPGADLSIWRLDQNGNRVRDPGVETDENGFFAFTPEPNRNYLIRAGYQGREVASPQEIWSFNSGGEGLPQPQAQTVFFTDRTLYRPGQTIQFKGICLWVDQVKDDYQILKGESLTVVFRDRNGKDIARQAVRANDFGSFSGSFVAPRDRVLGQMTLQVEGRAQGNAWFRVEEYKRPKFQVTLEAPKQAAKLNDTVSLTGHAMTYAGAAVDAAPVHYRVVRQARMPWWWGWYSRPWLGSESQEITHGTLVTKVDGSFTVAFTAKPDPKVPEGDDPTFVYQVNVDVTDSTGETRSAEHETLVGYTALAISLSASEWQTINQPVPIAVSARTLDGEPQVVEGRVLVYDLQSPARPQPAYIAMPYRGPYLVRRSPGTPFVESKEEDLSSPNNWPLANVVAEMGFTTDTNGEASLSFKLPAGVYRAVVESQDRFGKKVTGRLPLHVFQPDATTLGIKLPHLLTAPAWQLQPGQVFTALWGTGYEFGRAFVEVEHRHKILRRFWTDPDKTQQQIQVAVTEAMRGGFTLHVTQIRENRAYLQSRKVEVPWENKTLNIQWQHFVSKLQPDQKETWTAVISPRTQQTDRKDPALDVKTAEMVATLYDESLDAFAPFDWPRQFGIFRQDNSRYQSEFANQASGFQYAFGNWGTPSIPVQIQYRAFPSDLTSMLWGYTYFGAMRSLGRGMVAKGAQLKSELLESENMPAASLALDASAAVTPLPGSSSGAMSAGVPPKNLGEVAARKNLNETAFFYPQLTCDSNGAVRLTFTMPEALTKWRFLAFAHDQSVRSGFLQDHAVTSKDLMVQPNPPRFLREGDDVEFTVKVSNQSDKQQSGTVRLTFTDALTGRSADALLALKAVGGGSDKSDQDFSIAPKQSRGFSWHIRVPDGCGYLTYKAVGASATVSDGEEGAVPVLSRRVLVTESLPLPIRGPGIKRFEFSKLLKSGDSKTLQNQSLTAQMVSNPAWYAVLALPYLMEYPHECSEQVFNRLYANVVARTIAGSNPKIHRVFEQWRNTPALESPLEKNQDLKSVMLEETPWLKDAQSESEARKNVGILFDDNRLEYETQRMLEKLAQMQLADGSWPWFPGGYGNDFITLYITTGFGRLRHLGADVDTAAALRSLTRLDSWMNDEYGRIQNGPQPEKYVPSSLDALYLYGRSFFLKDQAIAAEHKNAIEFFLAQSRKFWLATNCRQTQGQLAIALARFSQFQGKPDGVPVAILKSIKERSVSNEEMGMFWRDTELSWWWYRAPIETQALMIEAFDEVLHDQNAVEECKVWLLKQKQTQDWKTTKATADAVYALLLRGKNLLSSDALVQLKLGGQDRTPGAHPEAGSKSEVATGPEAGTGFYEVRFVADKITPKLGEIVVKKPDPGVAWGSVHWQYLEDISKVTPYTGTPLKLTKTLFIKKATNRGQVLEPITGEVHVGDELVVRLELRVDRDMEYVHLKDQRGSGTEPLNVLSQYKYQDGLAYYESTRDTASHFFIDYLPKGNYVFEYSTRVQLRGQYQSGIAEIQCMYAPEFGSHSGSVELNVK